MVVEVRVDAERVADGSSTMKRITLAVVTAFLAWSVGAPAHAGVNIAPKPLSMATGQPPNILLILDNSNTMAENLEGTVAADCAPGPDADCVAGAASPLSKSEMIRDVGRGLLTTYRDQINLGLMAYQQYPLGSEWSDVFDDQIWLGRLGTRLYDVSYNPSNYDEDFSGFPWDSSTKAFRVPNPNSSGNHIHYNIGVPGYGPNDRSQYCFTRDPDGGYQEEGFRFRCFASKTGTSDAVPADETDPGGGFSGHQGVTTGYLSDSARARGVTHWGRHMVFLQHNHPEWVTVGSPGRGYLHTPIRRLDQAQADALALKLAPQHHDTSNSNLLTDPEEPVIVAGLTPLQGTLLTARDYFLDQTQNFGNAQGRNNAEYPLPESCDVNAAIWLTDGMPSVRVDGEPYEGEVDQALADAVAAAGSFHEDAGVDVYVVGFAMPPAVPDDALEQLAIAGGTESPFLANDPDALFDAVNDIFQQIIADSQAEFGSLSSGAVMRLDSIGFRTQADPSDWTGDVIGVHNPDGNESVIWRASEKMPQDWADRTLLTEGGSFDPGNGELMAAITDENDGDDAETIATRIINYVRGDASLEQGGNPGGSFQARSSLIGAVVGSQLALQRPVNHGWDRLEEYEENYRTHVQQKANRRNVVYVGSNAGVMHAIDAESGEEIWGYVPRAVWPRLRKLADPATDFVYTVDGSMTLVDAYWGGSWKTVLLGTLGAGGKGLFAIDVTNPDNPNVLWEVTPEDMGEHGADLGYTFARPQITRLDGGDFVVVVGNGYGSENNDSRLLVFDVNNGNVRANMPAGTGSSSNPNGLSTPRVALERPEEHHGRWVYAGDLQGTMWRFDLDSLNSSAQSIHSGNRPITAAPQTSYPPSGNGYVVSFGTGKFFEVGDNTTSHNEAFYVIYDLDPEEGTPGSDLENRSFGGSSTGEQEAIDLEDHDGWYVNLGPGERVLMQSRVVSDMVLFSTYQPSDDPCTVGGENAGYLLRVGSGEGAFSPDFTGRIDGIEGPPAGVGFAVRQRPEIDPDTGEVVPGDVEVVVRVGQEEIALEDSFEWAEDLAYGRRQNWMQVN
jgi:type IV pilus assembly protein PilY1